jgi:DNA-binding transcriptional MerR regulator
VTDNQPITARTLRRARHSGGWLSSGPAAAILQVHLKTLARWDQEGRLKENGVRVQKTLGGHRRYSEQDLRALVERLKGGQVVIK